MLGDAECGFAWQWHALRVTRVMRELLVPASSGEGQREKEHCGAHEND